MRRTSRAQRRARVGNERGLSYCESASKRSEGVLQSELHAAAGRHGVGGLPEAGRFEEADGDAVVGAIGNVKDVGPQSQVLPVGEGEPLAEREIKLKHTAGAGGVAPRLAVLADGREQAGRVARREPQRLAAVAGDDEAVGGVQTVG